MSKLKQGPDSSPVVLPTHLVNIFDARAQPIVPEQSALRPALLSKASIPKIYAHNDLGLFCKLEVRLEKKARIPIKFRLGEVQYEAKLEGKN